MGYEVKLYVVLESPSGMKSTIHIKDDVGHCLYESESGERYYYETDGNTRIVVGEDGDFDVKEMRYSQVLAMVDVCKPGYSSKLMRNVTWSPTDKYFYNGNTLCVVDSYGEALQEADIADVIAALEEDCEEGYRRFKTALALLKSITEEDYPEGVKVLRYGY